MERWVLARRGVHGDPELLKDVLVADTIELLQAATGAPLDPPAGDGSITVTLPARLAGIPVHKSVTVHVGEARRLEHWLTIPLRWDAGRASAVVPSFEGSIEVEDLSSSAMDLVVVGRYHPPMGPIGDAIDLTSMYPLAQRTIQWLAERLAEALSARVAGTAPRTRRWRGSMVVADVMTKDPLALAEDLPLRGAASLLLYGKISGAPVIDAEGLVVGVLSERDLLDKAAPPDDRFGKKAASARRRYGSLTVGEACSRPAMVTEADTPLREAAGEMARHDVDRLVVMDGATHVGIVTRRDILRALVRDDDDIQDAVREVLDGLDHPAVQAHVAGGVVALLGDVKRLSQVGIISSRLRMVDGVIDLDDSGLSWEYDDVTPPFVPMA